MRQAVSYGDDMWALGLLVGELVTGRLTLRRRPRLSPVSVNQELLLEIVGDVETVLGGRSPLFHMFTCLLHKDPALRLSARQLHIWLDSGARPVEVAGNDSLLEALRHWRQLRGVGASALSADGDTDPRLLACLKKARLDKFAQALAEQGFETLEDMKGCFAFEDSFLTTLRMCPGHIMRFRKMLTEIATM